MDSHSRILWKHPGLIKAQLVNETANDPNNNTVIELAQAKTAIKTAYIATMFISRAHNARYKKLKDDLVNQYPLLTDKYSMNINEAANKLLQTKPYQDAKEDKAEVAFAQAEEDKPRPKKPGGAGGMQKNKNQ